MLKDAPNDGEKCSRPGAGLPFRVCSRTMVASREATAFSLPREYLTDNAVYDVSLTGYRQPGMLADRVLMTRSSATDALRNGFGLQSRTVDNVAFLCLYLSSSGSGRDALSLR